MCILLVLCMLLQPFIPVIARPVEGTDAAGGGGKNYNSSSVDEAQQEFQKTYDTVMSLKEIDLEGFASACVGGVSTGKNIGIWFENLGDKVFNGGQNQKEYVDYLGDIERANEQIRKAQAQMTEMKQKMDAGDVDKAKNADPSKVADGAIRAQAEAMNTLRSTMTTAGETLVNIGELCETVSTILGVLDLILKGICLIPVCAPAIPILEPISEICGTASTALGIAGPMITAAGESLIESAEMGYTSDAQILGNLALDVGEEGVKQAVCHYATKGCEKLMGGTANYLADSFGDNADDILGTANAFWDPKSTLTQGVGSALFGDDFAKQFAERGLDELAEDFMEGTSEFLVDTALDASGISMPSGGDLVEEVIGDTFDAGKEAIKDATVRKTVQPAGLNVGDDD